MKHVTGYSIWILALSLCLASLTGCNSLTGGTGPAAPVITRFTANPTTVTAGASVSLMGVFANGTGVITPGNMSATSGTAVSVTPSDTTTYTLTVTNSAGATAELTATVMVNAGLTPQTIAFANPGPQTIGTPLTLVATASSGLTVSFASTTTEVCTVSNTTAAFIATGTCSITASQAGNSTYAAATPVLQSFTVNGKAQTITFLNPGAQTVGTPLTLSATATSNLTVSFASTTTSVCTVAGTPAVATFVEAGTCTITASQAGNSTYAAATPVLQSFTVNGKAQTITFLNPGAQTVGMPLTLVATASSGLAVSYTSTTTSVCTVSGATATFIAAGTCSITATQAGNATYAAAAPVSQSFTVTGNSPEAQTITFVNPGAQTVGTPLTLSATATSGLTVSFASTTTSICTVTGTTAAFSAQGTCTITASQAGNSAYAAATPVTQSFMVNSASATYYTLPAQRTTLWQPGVTYNSGIPTNRTQCGATVAASGDTTGVTDQANIQTAIDNCTANHYVLLGPGMFYIQVPSGSNGGLYIEQSSITLRGSGAGTTVLDQVGSSATTFGIIIVGAQWYHWAQDSDCGGQGNCTDTAVGTVTAADGIIPLSTDTVKESYTATVATSDLSVLSTPLAVGEIVQITEQFDPNYIWYDPTVNAWPQGQCGTGSGATASNVNGYCGWGEDGNDSSLGVNEDLVSRPIGQTNQITAISTNGATTTITFAAPWHHAFRVSHAADIARPGGTPQMLTGIGIEDLTAANGGGGDGGGNIVFWAIANSWMKNIESYNAGGGAVHFDGCFRCELRDSYVHTAGNPNPGGGGYGMEIDTYTSDSLIENNISWSFNKVMVMRGDGGGNVIGYNYFEDGYGAGYGGCEYGSDIGSVDPQGGQPYTSNCSGIPEAGMNATHMTGTQYALFEGNQSFNISEDDTWGNATYITFFRNHAATLRRNVNNGAGTDNDDGPNCSAFPCFGPVVQLADSMGRVGINVPAHQWWHSYVGNVIGYPDNYLQNPAIGYAYPATFSAAPASATWFFEWNGINNGGASPDQNTEGYWAATLWELGDGNGNSPDAPSTLPGTGGQTVLNTVLRDGNFDYVTGQTHWMGTNNLCNAPGDAACVATNTGNICTDQNLCAGQYTTPPAVSALPNSLYIPASMQPPPFFNGGSWPWVDGTNASNPLPGTLPARMRFDAGTPNIVPTSGGGGETQTITFNNPGTQTVGTPLTLVATATSGLPVSFTSNTTSICTVNNTTATFLIAGTCSITASQAGNGTYAAALPVTQSFSVIETAGGNTVAYSSCPAPTGSGVTYTIGMLNSSGQPSGPQTIADFSQWNNLNPGDVVCIYGKSTPYAERLVLTQSGSDDQHRIRIVGVIQGGHEPILTGKSATTADAFNYGAEISQNYEGGEVSVTGLNYGTPVAYLNIEGLTIQGATTAEVGGTVASPTFSNNTYSDININGGAQGPWGCGSAGINLIRSDHISIIHNRIKDNDNGIFVNSNNGNTSSNILVEYNHIYGNGVASNTVNSCGYDSHGTYTEAENITYLGNRFGALRQGQAVNLLKDRSSGLYVEYNLFLPDGVLEASLGDELLVGSTPGPIGHLLDLVESYDTSVGPPGGLAALGAVYQNVSVYGNIFFDDGAAADGSQGSEDAVHFGGDQGNSDVYRKYLHYYNNTVVARRADGVGWLEMEPTTNAGAWNNIFYAAYVGSSTPPAFNLLSTWCYDKQYGGTCGTVSYLSQNWNSLIWGTTGVNGTGSTPSFVNLANNDVHIATDDPTIVGNGQTGDSSYPANATTIPIEYADFLSTVTRPFSQAKIDLGALGYSANTTGGQSQTIDFVNPGTQTVGSPLTLVATSTSGLPVSFTSTTTSNCTVNNTTATFLIAGTCMIQAAQAGNATYAAATPVSQSFTVNSASGGDPTVGVLPSYDDAYANWKNAGLALVGGIPNRTTICATVNPLGGGQDDYTNIQNAINNCPAGEVVQFAAGAFSVLLADLPIHISKGITLRGTGNCTGSSSPYCQTSIIVTDGILPYQVNGFSPLCGTSSSTATACPNGGEPEILISPVLPDYNYSWEQCGNVGATLGTGCGATPLAADAVQGQTTIQVTSTTGFTVGSWVLIDEASGAGWQPDPMNQWTGYGSVWAASDWLSPSGSPATGRVAWAKFDVSVDYEGDFGAASSDTYPYQANTPGCWHSYCDRPTAELHKIASMGAGPCPGTNCTVTFDDPLTIAFRESGGHNAQIYANLYGNNSATGSPISFLQNAGVENISLLRSPEGGLEMELCANCWVKNTEIGDWVGGGLSLEYSARSEINTVYVHHCWDSVNNGGEYPIDLGNASTEMLITNSITNFGGKGMVARSGGAGSVISYNYIDDTMYDDNSGIGDYWLDMSVNASHEVGPHHVLFEGNWGDNLDSDNTHGNSTYITFFRNLGTGLRTPFDDPSIGSTALVDDYTGKGYYCPSGLASCVSNTPGPLRAAGPMAYSYWFAFVGNVLGVSGTTTAANKWTYSGDFLGNRIFMLGWDGGNGGQDPNMDGTTGSYIFINGNYDYLNNAVTWQGSPVTLPNSFYLSSTPSFFTSRYPWPWVTPTGSEQIQNGPSGCGGPCSGLPAQARWQAGTPFVQP